MRNTANTEFSEKGQRMIKQYEAEDEKFFVPCKFTTIDTSAFQVLGVDPSYFPGFDPTLKGLSLQLNCEKVIKSLAKNEDMDRFYKFLALMRLNKNDK